MPRSVKWSKFNLPLRQPIHVQLGTHKPLSFKRTVTFEEVVVPTVRIHCIHVDQI